MSPLKDAMEERWTKRRQKGYNWSKLVIMLIALIGIIVGMNFIKRSQESGGARIEMEQEDGFGLE